MLKMKTYWERRREQEEEKKKRKQEKQELKNKEIEELFEDEEKNGK